MEEGEMKDPKSMPTQPLSGNSTLNWKTCTLRVSPVFWSVGKRKTSLSFRTRKYWQYWGGNHIPFWIPLNCALIHSFSGTVGILGRMMIYWRGWGPPVHCRNRASPLASAHEMLVASLPQMWRLKSLRTLPLCLPPHFIGGPLLWSLWKKSSREWSKTPRVTHGQLLIYQRLRRVPCSRIGGCPAEREQIKLELFYTISSSSAQLPLLWLQMIHITCKTFGTILCLLDFFAILV